MNSKSAAPPIDLQTTFEAIPGKHVILLPNAPTFTIVGATDSFLKTAYRTRDEIIGRPLFEVFPDNTTIDEATGVLNLRSSLEYVIAQKDTHKMADQRYDIVNPETGSFEVKFWTASNKPVLNSEGTVQYIIHTTEDVTERVRLQKENDLSRESLEKSESRFRALVNASSDVIYRLNADWTIMYPLDGRGFLLDAHAPVENWMEINVHPSEFDRVKKTIAAAITNKSVFELEHQVLTADGTPGWTFSRAVPILNDAGNIVEWFGTASDITNRKMIEESLKESESRFRTMVEQAQVPIAMTRGSEMIYEAINAAMLELIGKTGTNVLEKNVREVLPELEGQAVMDILRQVWDTGQPSRGQELPVTFMVNGEPVHKYYNFSYTRVAPEGKVQYIIHLAIDVTEQVIARQKIEEVVAQRTKELSVANESLLSLNKELQRSNQNLEEFAHAASHDLKEPVRKIHFYTNQLKGELNGQLDERQARAFNRIENASERMGNLIDDLLLYSHVSQRPHDTETIDLNKKVQRALEDLELDVEEKKAIINVGKLPVVQGYRRQLQQLFQNLISNALKYSKAGTAPQIHISASEVLEHGRQYHLIEIKDNGIGFEQEYGEKIFQMFTRLHGKAEYSGTGVGLSIVKKVVENHHGFIEVESAVGEGSVFKIYLPV
jgi:PAS domain S-box-containing protein